MWVRGLGKHFKERIVHSRPESGASGGRQDQEGLEKRVPVQRHVVGMRLKKSVSKRLCWATVCFFFNK